MRRKPMLLDLFCGAGGASMGYHRAGFDVVGVDSRPQPRYPFEFVQADAMQVSLNGFAFVHASPPCQAYSRSRHRVQTERRRIHPDLIDPTRDRLIEWGGVYVIENVPEAPLRDPVILCGGAFGCRAACPDGVARQLRRHRGFESNLRIGGGSVGCHCQPGEKIGVYGNGGSWANTGDPDRRGYKGCKAESAEAMQIGWMTIAELSQAIPPAYTHYIGMQLITAVS